MCIRDSRIGAPGVGYPPAAAVERRHHRTAPVELALRRLSLIHIYSKILVKEKQAVSKGQKIAEMGSTDAESPRLHFEIRRQGKPVDPAKYLPPR